jgi:hypothetical protein
VFSIAIVNTSSLRSLSALDVWLKHLLPHRAIHAATAAPSPKVVVGPTPPLKPS